MIKSVTATNYLGDSITMVLDDPASSGLIVKEITGLGPVTATINTTELSTLDGAVYNSARASSRNIVLHLQFLDSEGESIEDIRHKTYKYFPLKKKVTLLIETDTRLCETFGYVESNEPNIFSQYEDTQISIICPDSYFYSVNVNTVDFNSLEGGFEFEFSNDSLTDPLLEFAQIISKEEETIYYDGDAEVGITIYIHATGEFTNLTIYNSNTREYMTIDTDKLHELTGETISSGDEITISTVKGEKAITLSRGGETINILNCLGKGSTWFQLVHGDNVFVITAESGSEYAQIIIENRVLFEGI